MRQTDLYRSGKPLGLLSRNCFELLVKSITAFVTLLASRFLGLVQRARWCTQSRSRMPGSSRLLCNGGAPPRTSRSAGPRSSSDHRQQRANCRARHDELSPIASPCRQPRRSTARAVSFYAPKETLAPRRRPNPYLRSTNHATMTVGDEVEHDDFISPLRGVSRMSYQML